LKNFQASGEALQLKKKNFKTIFLSFLRPVFAVLDPDPLTPGDHKEMSSTLAD
jgi:hypothetical protein